MKALSLCERGRSVFEALLTLLIVAAALLLAMERLGSSARSVKEKALMMELANLRRAVIQYAIIEKRLPVSLKELTEENMEVPSPGFKGEYKIKLTGKSVEGAVRDEKGRPLDPFGAAYNYDPETGRVWSASEGYANW